MNISTLISKESAEKINEVRALLESHSIESISIKTDAEAEGALTVVTSLKTAKKELEAKKDVEMSPHYDKYVEIRDSFNAITKKIDEITSAFDRAYKNYKTEQQRIAAEKQRQLDQKAADDRRKAEEQAAAARAKADEYSANGRDDLAAKQDAKAAELSQKAVETVAPIVTANVVQNVRGGFNTRKVWKGRITDIKKVLTYFYNRGTPPNVQAEIQKYADAQARASRGVKSTIQGIEFYED